MQRLSHFFLDTTPGQVVTALALTYALLTGLVWLARHLDVLG